MATLKIVIRKNQKKLDGTCNIKIRLCHRALGQRSKVTYFSTPYSIDPKFVLKSGHLSPKYPSYSTLSIQLETLRQEYQSAHDKIDVETLELMTIKALAERLSRTRGAGEGIIKYMERRFKEMESDGRTGTAYLHRISMEHLKLFSGKEDIPFSEFNIDFLERFQKELLRTKQQGTVSNYLNVIKTNILHAVNRGYLKPEANPFNQFRIIKLKTNVKRNLKVEEFKKVLNAEKTAKQEFAFDIFKAMIFLQGINSKDLVRLTKSNIKKGRIEYERAKTGTFCSVLLRPELQEIINKHSNSEYLFPMPYKSAITASLDKLLTAIGKKAGIESDLTTNWARHTVAATAKRMLYAKEIQSDLLFHQYGSKITDGYTEADYTNMDKAMNEIIKVLLYS